MKNSELNDLGLQEMELKEMTTIEGGALIGGDPTAFLGGLLGAVLGTVTAVAGDAGTFVNKTLANVLKLIMMK